MSVAVCDPEAFYPLRRLVAGPFTDLRELTEVERFVSSFNKIPQVVSKEFPNQFQNNSPVSFKTIPHFFY